MGQYYKAMFMNEETGAITGLDSWSYDNGAKIMEHSYVGNKFVSAAMQVLANSKEPVRVAWVGDYADDDLDKFGTVSDIRNAWKVHDMYRAAWRYEGEEFNGLQPEDIPGFTELWEGAWVQKGPKAWEYTGTYLDKLQILNDSKKEYVAIPKWKPRSWAIHPLPLLTCIGNGLGGGDYHGTRMEDVGRWCGDIIRVADDHPKGYKRVAMTFEEDR